MSELRQWTEHGMCDERGIDFAWSFALVAKHPSIPRPYVHLRQSVNSRDLQS